MNFFTAAGFATPRVAALAPAGNTAPMIQPSIMRSVCFSQESALQRIASTVRESAITRHQMDFERVDRRTEAISQLKGTIVELKSRLELKSGGRSRLALAEPALQLSYKAS